MYDSFYGNNPRNNKERPIPTVRPVNRSKEQLKEFRDILSDPTTSQGSKKRFMVEKAGGYCSMCGDIATQIASYDMIDATLVEKYCDNCLARGIN
jgi:Zn finger protein HypA/HybF involved in hydrogenase expression